MSQPYWDKPLSNSWANRDDPMTETNAEHRCKIIFHVSALICVSFDAPLEMLKFLPYQRTEHTPIFDHMKKGLSNFIWLKGFVIKFTAASNAKRYCLETFWFCINIKSIQRKDGKWESEFHWDCQERPDTTLKQFPDNVRLLWSSPLLLWESQLNLTPFFLPELWDGPLRWFHDHISLFSTTQRISTRVSCRPICHHTYHA